MTKGKELTEGIAKIIDESDIEDTTRGLSLWWDTCLNIGEQILSYLDRKGQSMNDTFWLKIAALAFLTILIGFAFISNHTGPEILGPLFAMFAGVLGLQPLIKEIKSRSHK